MKRKGGSLCNRRGHQMRSGLCEKCYEIKVEDQIMEIIKTYRQSMPAVRFIGKKYVDSDRVNGMFGKQWGDWFANGWFKALKLDNMKTTDAWIEPKEDGDAYIGLMRWKEGEPFEYWIGTFLPAGTEAPDGYGFIDFPPSDLGVAWLYGKEPDLYKHEMEAAESCGEHGFKIITDSQGAWWVFERYQDRRFSTPDEKGNVVLDICLFIKSTNRMEQGENDAPLRLTSIRPLGDA
jgi:hypothetical protein